MARLRPIKDDKELQAIPVDQPVLVELEPAVSATDAAPPEKVSAPEKTNEEDPAVKQLKEQLAARDEALRVAQADRDRALQAQRDRDAELQRVKAERDQGEESSIKSALAAAQAEQDQAKSALAKAFETGDANGIAEANAKIARAASKIVNLEANAASLADQREAAKTAPQQQQPQQDVNAFIDSQTGLVPKERDWLKTHPELVMDQRRFEELRVGHNRAEREGHVRGTDGYFEYLDKFLGFKKDAPVIEDEDENERTAIMAAPVSRSAAPSKSGPINGSQVRLSPEQREIARNMGLSDRDYALGLVAFREEKAANPEKFRS